MKEYDLIDKNISTQQEPTNVDKPLIKKLKEDILEKIRGWFKDHQKNAEALGKLKPTGKSKTGQGETGGPGVGPLGY